MQQMWLKASITGLVMILNSINDIRKREIFPFMTIVLSVTGVILRCLDIYEDGGSLAAFFPAFVILAAVLFLENAAGLGDVLILVFMGIWLNDETVLLAFAYALAGASVISLVLCSKKSIKYDVPFVPFLTAGIIAAEITQKVIL